MRRLVSSAIAVLLLAASAQAKDLVLDLPAHIDIETFPAPGPSDKDRCIGASFVEFPEIRNAKSYQVTVKDVKYGQPMMDPVGPPFPADHHSDFPAHWNAPRGFHRFALSGASTGQGCAQAILGLEGQWQIVSAKVNMTQKFSQRFRRKDPEQCKVELEGMEIKVKPSFDRVMVIGRRGGRVTMQDPFVGNQQMNVYKNAFGTKGTVVTTGAKSAVSIRTLDGDEVIIGPGMKVRLNPGRSIEILERTKGSKELPRAPHYKIRTDGCTLSSRG
jgi:hypothetical protein